MRPSAETPTLRQQIEKASITKTGKISWAGSARPDHSESKEGKRKQIEGRRTCSFSHHGLPPQSPTSQPRAWKPKVVYPCKDAASFRKARLPGCRSGGIEDARVTFREVDARITFREVVRCNAGTTQQNIKHNSNSKAFS